MSEEPQLPPIPAIGEILGRKDRFYQVVYTVITCSKCQASHSRDFKVGDFTFKKLEDEHCKKCSKKNSLSISEIYSEWIDPKKR